MKKVTTPFLVLLAAISFVACKKDSMVNAVSLDATKTSAIKKGEPVVFTLSGAPAGSTVNWSVTPTANVQINQTGNKASLLFGKAGNYEVTANTGSLTARGNVTVSDSAYTGGGGITYTLVPLNGDQIKLTPSRIDSGSTSGLIIYAITSNSYNCLNNFLVTGLNVTGADYVINYSGVNVPDAANCTSGQSKSAGMSYMYPVTDGNYVFKVVLNGTTYTGAFVKSGTTYTFTWPYTSGVTISPLVIN